VRFYCNLSVAVRVLLVAFVLGVLTGIAAGQGFDAPTGTSDSALVGSRNG